VMNVERNALEIADLLFDHSAELSGPCGRRGAAKSLKIFANVVARATIIGRADHHAAV
jgi:hypothetical protein